MPSAKSEKSELELEKELIEFKASTFETLEGYNSIINKLEKELEHYAEIKLQNTKLKKELIDTKDQLEKVIKENNKLKKLKMYKITKKYWLLRKKVLKGASSK